MVAWAAAAVAARFGGRSEVDERGVEVDGCFVDDDDMDRLAGCTDKKSAVVVVCGEEAAI